MKKILIPSPITIYNLDGSLVLINDQPLVLTFADFVQNTLLIDPKFGKSMADIFSAIEIKDKLKNEKEIDLDNEDYIRLLHVAEEPTNAYNPIIVMQLGSFLKAIKNAT